MQASQTHRESVEYHLSMSSHLQGYSLVPRMYSYVLAMRTFHYHLHLIDEVVDNVKSLCSSYLGLVQGESIESI